MDWANDGTGGSSGNTGSSTNSNSFWSMNGMGPWMLASLLTSLFQAGTSIYYQEKALDTQERAQKKAEAKQAEADYNAEQKRLAALAKNQQAQGFDFGVDSALAKRYADAAQKWSAGTGSLSEDEDNENPFYTRGLL